MDRKADFYLISTDCDPPLGPIACFVERRLPARNRKEDFLLAKVEPSINWVPKAGENEWVVFAVRFVGQTLFPLCEWPTYVYVCRLINTDAENIEIVSDKELKIVLWGEIYKTEEQAIAAIDKYKEQLD